MKSIHGIKVFRHPGAGRGPVAAVRPVSESQLDSGLRRNDGRQVIPFFVFVGMLMPGGALAHTSPVAHEHPHAHALDGALMSYGALALMGLICIAAMGVVLALARIRRRK